MLAHAGPPHGIRLCCVAVGQESIRAGELTYQALQVVFKTGIVGIFTGNAGSQGNGGSVTGKDAPYVVAESATEYKVR